MFCILTVERVFVKAIYPEDPQQFAIVVSWLTAALGAGGFAANTLGYPITDWFGSYVPAVWAGALISSACIIATLGLWWLDGLCGFDAALRHPPLESVDSQTPLLISEEAPSDALPGVVILLDRPADTGSINSTTAELRKSHSGPMQAVREIIQAAISFPLAYWLLVGLVASHLCSAATTITFSREIFEVLPLSTPFSD